MNRKKKAAKDKGLNSIPIPFPSALLQDDQKDPAFRTNLRFLINIIKSADKNGDDKISFEG